MSEKFLYGASIQGIQSFIFQTNKLKDIVGASELVKQICKDEFAKLLYEKQKPPKEHEKKLEHDRNAILCAAGNIKYVFENKSECEKIVKKFPKKVLELAPGITISQAVVSYQSDDDFSNAIEELEKRLKAQRNKPVKSLTLGLIGIHRSRNTGLPAVEKEGDDFLDAGAKAKRDCFKKMKHSSDTDYFGIKGLSINEVAKNIDDMTGKNDWIAVVHIDGNGLGSVVQKIGCDKEKFKDFSKILDECTIKAADEAYQRAIVEHISEERIPYRPIVLGGDDHTLICRADLAVKYTKVFLENFEKETKDKLSDILVEGKCGFNYLTACAGIAFVKSSYPFYYASDLAEALCSEAKKDAKKKEHLLFKDSDGKGLPPSCLLFHKVQDSFVESFKDIRNRELTPSENASFFFGPYYLGETVPDRRLSINRLQEYVSILETGGKDGNAVKSHLRQWMSLLHRNPEAAMQQKKRVESLLTGKLCKLVEEVTDGSIKAPDKNRIKEDTNKSISYYPVYDLLSLHSIKNQETNTPDNGNN